MSYKIKSLLYFICFVASAVLYHTLEMESEQKESAEILQLETAPLENDQTIAELKEILE
ncbi:hypothetical protein [Arenibacter aquaticus]|uniref:hypothetical protein n=1 Tax=Arenibacter aquaticus TaxID=2489054 RepID=UPI0013048A2C|nr:hypothetical protein [Arenibacter aquaticus]